MSKSLSCQKVLQALELRIKYFGSNSKLTSQPCSFKTVKYCLNFCLGVYHRNLSESLITVSLSATKYYLRF